MKNSEDIKMNIGGKFINNQYNNVQELMADINKLCKQVVKEQLALYNVSGRSEQLKCGNSNPPCSPNIKFGCLECTECNWSE